MGCCGITPEYEEKSKFTTEKIYRRRKMEEEIKREEEEERKRKEEEELKRKEEEEIKRKEEEELKRKEEELKRKEEEEIKRKEEEEIKRKEEEAQPQEIIEPSKTKTTSFKPYSDPKKDLTEEMKENIEKILGEAPERINTTLEKLINYLSEKAKNLSEVEKAWLVFRWMAENIEYDCEGCQNNNADVSNEGAFNLGKTVCSGYSRLYKRIGGSLGLEIVCIVGYAKGYNYIIGQKFYKTNHEWNAIKIKGEWYFIESTWGTGYATDEFKFQKKFQPFYFCTDPSQFIYEHLPEDSNWQLLNNPISMEEYSEKPQIYPDFFIIGFTRIEPNKSLINSQEQEGQIKIYCDNTKELSMMASLYYLKNNTYSEQENKCFVSKNENFFLVNYSTFHKGDYRLTLFGKKPGMDEYGGICNFKIINEKENKDLSYPLAYSNYNESDLQLIEPKFSLIKGKKYNFQLRTKNYESLYAIVNDDYIKLEKSNDNLFIKKEVLIDGDNNEAFIAVETSKHCYTPLLKFNIIQNSKKSKNGKK